MIGVSLKRKEDPRLLTGRGKYAGDVRLPGMLHAGMALNREALAQPHRSAGERRRRIA